MSEQEKVALDRYPRAQHSIGRWKGMGGIGCFMTLWVGALTLVRG